MDFMNELSLMLALAFARVVPPRFESETINTIYTELSGGSAARGARPKVHIANAIGTRMHFLF